MLLQRMFQKILSVFYSLFGIHPTVNPPVTNSSLSSNNVTNESLMNEMALSTIIKSFNEFSSDFYTEIALENKDRNLVCSSLSTHIVLSLLGFGARGQTALQMDHVLYLPENKATILWGYYQLQQELKNIKNGTLKMANRIYLTNNWLLNEKYKNMINIIQSGVNQLDANPSKAVEKINTWVKNETNHAIDRILNDGDIDSETSIVVLNAIYFKAKWAHYFDKRKTSPENFYIGRNKTVEVPMMYADGYFVYGSSEFLDAKYIEIPFENKKLKMILIVPNKVNGLCRLYSRLQYYEDNNETSKFKKQKIELYMPRFKIESHINLESMLRWLGLSELFYSSADFSGISNEPIYVSQAVQRTKIEVNEDGAKASSATMLKRSIRSAPFSTTLRVDRPFYFALKFQDLRILEGHVINPMNM